jgi:hypothetical protein
VFGGGGLDVMIANTGGDRLFDWGGEFNSYIVPFSPFGAPTVLRSPSPSIMQFLRDLGFSSASDQTIFEPSGELGLVTQSDPQWQDQHGPPRDPPPGNLPGVQRDTQGGIEQDCLPPLVPIVQIDKSTNAVDPSEPTPVENADVAPASGQAASDSDSAHHFGAETDIQIKKAANAVDPANPTSIEEADDLPGPQFVTGTDMVWTYRVLNGGKFNLDDVLGADLEDDLADILARDGLGL